MFKKISVFILAVLMTINMSSYSQVSAQELLKSEEDITEEEYMAQTTTPSNLKIETLTAEGEQPILSFPVMSDVHVNDWLLGRIKLKRALQQYNRIEPKYDFITVVGDITDDGSNNHYDNFFKTLNKYKRDDAEVLFCIGNHEIQDSKDSKEDEMRVNRFVEKTGMPGLYHDQWIKGYHFIFIGQDSAKEFLPEEQIEWLEEKLSEDEDYNKPIFVFFHQPMDDTVVGTHNQNSVHPNDKIFSVFSKHPQVILFNGHTHYNINHEGNMYQGNFTAINTGAVKYLCKLNDDTESNLKSQGLYAQVFEDKVVVRGRDFFKDKWIDQQFVVNFPADTSTIDNEAPNWNDKQLDYNNLRGSSVELTWTEAEDKNEVRGYRVYKNEELALDTEEPINSAKIIGLAPEKDYEIRVEAYDEYFNETTNGPTVSIQTTELQEDEIEISDCVLDVNVENGSVVDKSDVHNSTELKGNAKVEYDDQFDKEVIVLDGDESYVKIPDNQALHASKEITLAAEFSLNSTDHTQDIVSKNDFSDYGFEFNGDTKQLEFWLNLQNHYMILESHQQIEPNTIYQAVAKYDGSHLNFYLNGEKVDSDNFLYDITNADIDLFIGADPPEKLARYFTNGKISTVKVFNRALTTEEIQRLFD